jgi:hypothetical protein
MFEQAASMYRADGPEELKSLGETQFVCGVAAMSDSGKFGPTRCIAGMVGYVDLRLGSRAKGLLERHIAISDGRSAPGAAGRSMLNAFIVADATGVMTALIAG